MQGCQTVSPRAELRLAQISFEGVVRSLTDMQKAGQIGKDEQAVISQLIHVGEEKLDEWQITVLTEDRRPAAAELFGSILNKLIQYDIEHGGD